MTVHNITIDYTSRIMAQGRTLCTGSQVATILQTICDLGFLHNWYAFDVEAAYADGCQTVPFPHSSVVERIGDCRDIVRACGGVSQFYAGVLAGADAAASVTELFIHCTEDVPTHLRPPVLLEMHLVDTTSIEIYTVMPTIVEALVKRCV